MRKPILAIGAVAVVAAGVCASEFEVRKEQTMGTQSVRAHDGKPFHIFNPETMARPTAGYSQVAEVGEGKIVYIAGRPLWTSPETWSGKTISARRCSKFREPKSGGRGLRWRFQ